MPWVADDPPPGQRLSMSQDADGTARGLLFDDQNRLVGHAKLRWVEDVADAEHEWPSADSDDRGEPSFRGSETSAPDIANLVPLALVAVAGIAAGVAGVKFAQKRKRRRQEERLAISTPTTAPAGWYEVEGGVGRLRYWDGAAWTSEYAQRATGAPSIAADWYPDPSNMGQVRYWNGAAWTHHVAPRPGVVTTPADWYPDPSNVAQLRYWDGNAWTPHVTGGADTSVAAQHTSSASVERGLANARNDARIQMSSAEWRAHVEAWARAGAIQQELWRRLTNAQITDGDEVALAAQRQWEELTPAEGARRIQLMLEANPSLRSQPVLEEFVRLFGDASEPVQRINARRPPQ